MKMQLKLEELAMAFAGIYLCTLTGIMPVWWLYFLLFFTPDIGMAGYLVNTRVGALTYNFLHHKGVAIAVWVIGFLSGNEYLQFAGLLMFAHSSFDRMLGYGLKYP